MSQPKKSKPPFAGWKKETMELAPDHGWRCTPGYKLCVMERGAIRFEYPDTWVDNPTPTSLKLHDRPFPDDSMVLEVSVLRTPPVDWNKMPSLDQMMLDGQRKSGKLFTEDDIHRIDIPGLYLVWVEYENIDENTHKPVVWRQAHCHQGALHRGKGLVGILTFGFYKEIYEQGDQTWNHIARSIVLGDFITDPRKGPRLN